MARTQSVTSTGRFPIVPRASSWLVEVRREIASFGNLPVDWASSDCERPLPVAVEMATAIASALARDGYRPDQIAPMADGGIALWYSYDEAAVRIEAVNEGEAVVVSRATAESAPEYTVTTDARAAANMVADLFR